MRARPPTRARLFIGSHLDTVPHAGAFDGVLGVVMGVALAESLDGRRLPFSIEVVGFSEEEGVRFGVPFIGSRAFVGDVDDALLARQDADGISIEQAIANFGLDPSRIGDARADANPSGTRVSHRTGSGPRHSPPSARHRRSHRRPLVRGCRSSPAPRVTQGRRRWTAGVMRSREPLNGLAASRHTGAARQDSWQRQDKSRSRQEHPT